MWGNQMFEFIYTFNLSCAVWCVVSPAAPTSTPRQSSIEQLRVKTLCGVLIVRARLLAGPRWAQEVWDLGLINCLARSSSVFTAHMDHTSHFYQGLGLMMSLWAVGFYVRKPYHRLEVDVRELPYMQQFIFIHIGFFSLFILTLQKYDVQ